VVRVPKNFFQKPIAVTGQYDRVVWDIAPDSGDNQGIFGSVTYGVPPKGWHTHVYPEPLACGNAYLVNLAGFFRLNCDGTVKVFSRESFFCEDKGSAH
jgi:hypothetical protein